ncbi:MAG TPA: DUF4956 domain-containing protein [Gemmatimonadaceae bacterium]|nr:DUF4956 domain-containing protein [Gemmatimonadaceae bacterium]
MATGRPSGAARKAGGVAIGVPLRVVAYYAVLALAVALAVRWLPPVSLSELLEPRGATDAAPRGIPELQGAIAATVAMVAAALLTLPVAWVYTLTHERRGFRQSVVHTLMLLPVVVAGVVVLVKNSIPLAFSLAGIVAAVRFRNTLEDSKDAVYIFLATGVGLAAGVSLPVAAALSVVFNLLIVTLWATDFARTPARTAARDARRRLERTLAAANRTGEFIARLDTDLLSKLPPTQLEALADRAWRRRKRAAPELDGLGKSADTLLRLRTSDVARLRPLIEPVLDARAKRVRYGGVVHEPNGVDWIEYRLGLKRSETADTVLTALREAGGELIDDAEMRR